MLDPPGLVVEAVVACCVFAAAGWLAADGWVLVVRRVVVTPEVPFCGADWEEL